MCGRYSFVAEDEMIRERFGIRVRTAIYKANYNCSPTQVLPVIASDAPDTLQFFRWGLIPSWTKANEPGKKPSLLINARAETVADKPSFRNSFRHRRCLVPASGFYEWKTEPGRGKKIPYHFGLKSGELFAMAGLWDEWVSPDGDNIRSFTIITTTPNELVAPFHDRMPVMLRREDEGNWLGPGSMEQSLLLRPFPASAMDVHSFSVP